MVDFVNGQPQSYPGFDTIPAPVEADPTVSVELSPSGKGSLAVKGTAAGVAVLVLLGLGWFMRGWVHFKKSLPRGAKKKILDARNEYVCSGNLDLFVEVVSLLQKMILSRESARNTCAQYIAIVTVLVNHRNGTFPISSDDHERFKKALLDLSADICA